MKYQDINSYAMFFSASFTQDFLRKSYLNQNIDQADQKSYQNCYPFIYYLEHGKIYYQQAQQAPLIIQPILLFYGYVHLIKACILSKDPNYPETTSVLAHGVSSRKRKKQQYRFMEDDVKFQKTGLFPFISDKLFHMKQLEGDKVTMQELLTNIPELSPLFFQLEKKKTFTEVKRDKDCLYISDKVLDSFHMTEKRFEDYLLTKFHVPFSITQSDGKLHLLETEGNNFSSKEMLPFRFNILEKQFFFPTNKGALIHFPEILIHYLLLYNLSMIARYETEWWSELLKMMPNNDFPFIQSFLKTTITKGPYLIYEYLVRGRES
ncbi:YaaC family protein [Neobacillus sp. LXY-4]|uniref:YaaC family protein n=1 Tax=Neobacillus sp. LXY-4 TaxID=3379826 RepID=UPI003EE3B490